MNQEHIITLQGDQSKQRLDQFLAQALENQSRSSLQKLLEQGKVTDQTGKILNKKDKISPAMTILVEIPPPEPMEAMAEPIPIDIVYEDEDVVVVNKPVGMVVHPAAGHPNGTLVNALLYHCGDSLSGIGGVQRPGIVHRIDRDTSGLLIVAKHDKAHAHLSAQLQDHSLRRVYYAITVGRMKEMEGTINAPLGRHPVHRQKIAIVRDNGKEAITHYKVLEQFHQFSLVECRLETGRTHQIRVHMASLNRALLGDFTYGQPYKGLQGQCLHAKELSFQSPSTGEQITVECPLPDWFEEMLEKLRRME